MNEDIFISVEECAKLLNVGRNTMLRMTRFPKFPAIYTRGRILIVRSLVEDWVIKHIGYSETKK